MEFIHQLLIEIWNIVKTIFLWIWTFLNNYPLVLLILGFLIKKPIIDGWRKIEVWGFKIINNFSKNKTVEDFFHIYKRENTVDLVAYQFGLRPNLPIIDILYLELLKKILKEKKINRIAIFPTIDKSTTSQVQKDYEKFKTNINLVFCEYTDKIEFVDPFRKSELTSTEIIQEDFIDTLNYLGSTEFYKEILRTSKQQIKGIQDFNKFHPKERAIMTLFTHVFKAWEVREYVFRHIQNSEQEKMNIGFVFWGVEYDKWGVYSRIAKDDKIGNVALFIGKSIIDRRGKPIPVFTNDALGIFDEEAYILEKVSKHTKKQVSALIEITSAILKDNYEENISSNNILLKQAKQLIGSLNTSNKSFGSVYSQVEKTLSNKEKMLFALILKLRSKYGC